MMRRVKILCMSFGAASPVPRPPKTNSRTLSSARGGKLFVCCVCGKEFPSADVLKAHYNFHHTAAILSLLRMNPIKTYTQIFGKRVKRQNNFELRFGNGVVVNVRKNPPEMTPSSHFGLWYDFVEGVGGGPLTAIQRARKVEYLEAVQIGAEITGLSMSELNAYIPHRKEGDTRERDGTEKLAALGKNAPDSEQVESRIQEAKRIWSSRVALPDTLGSRYLVQHRKIDSAVIERLDFSYLPKYPLTSDLETLRSTTTDGERASGPALLVPVRNSDWHLTGVQRIFLDERTAGKPKGIKHHKFSKGLLKGSAGIVQRGRGGGGAVVYVVEGPETGASVACAVDPDDTVVATLSLGNLGNMGHFLRSLKPSKVVLALDLDVKEAARMAMERATTAVVEELEKDDISWERRTPKPLKENVSADWNDVLVAHGLDELKRQLLGKEN